MKQLLIWSGLITIVICQNPNQNPIPGKTFGTQSGVFFNAGTNGLDLEGYFEIQSSTGFFGDIWLAQIDKDEETDLEINSSIGWMNEVAPNLILGGGFSNDATQNLNEIFLGGNVGLLTLIGYFGIDDTPANFLGILNLNMGPLKKSLFDISMMGIRESSGSDLFFRMARDFEGGIKLGYNFSRERFESEETKSFSKQGYTKTWTVPIQKDGFFHTIYFGLTF